MNKEFANLLREYKYITYYWMKENFNLLMSILLLMCVFAIVTGADNNLIKFILITVCYIVKYIVVEVHRRLNKRFDGDKPIKPYRLTETYENGVIMLKKGIGMEEALIALSDIEDFYEKRGYYKKYVDRKKK